MGVNVAEVPAFGERYMRLRDELWFSSREWFKTMEVKIPDDGALISELTLPTYGFTSAGKLKVEGKDEIKKRTARSAGSLGKSPDRADSFNLTFANKVFISKKPQSIVYSNAGIV